MAKDLFVSVTTLEIMPNVCVQNVTSTFCKAIKSKSLLLTSVITPTHVLVSLKFVLQVLSLYTKSPTFGLKINSCFSLPLTLKFTAQVLFICSPLYLTHKFSGDSNIPFRLIIGS